MKTRCIQQAKKTIKITNELITVIILCDTPGYRMKSYGPLPLITINNQKLIDLQIQAIQKTFSNFEIIICVGFDAEKICKYIRQKYSNLNIRVVENQLFNSSNSCESVRISLNNTFNDRILLCDGNLLFNDKILSLFNTDQTCVLVEPQASENLEIGINIDENNEAQYFSFGACKTWSEMIYLDNKDIIETLRKIISCSDNKNKFIFEAINEIIKIKYKIKCIYNKYSLQKISNIKTYHAIKGKK